MKMRILVPLALLLTQLAGCFGAAAIGVGASALVFADRRETETVLTDEGIELRASSRLNEHFGDRAHINITSYNRMVLLTGEVASDADKAEAEKLTGGVPNVRAISNELQVAGISSFTSRSNDSFITSKVKGRFIDANKFSANHVKVVTESSVVYLLGLVTAQEAAAAVEIARTTGGVRKVVRVMEIISEEEARRHSAAAGKDSGDK